MRLLLAVVLLLVSACAKRVAPPTEALELAARGLSAPDASARTIALAGYHALLMQNDPKRAKALFDQALQKSSVEPWAFEGELLLAQREADSSKQLSAALDLCERAPSHPLASVAARVAFELSGQALSLDEAMLARGPKLLANHELRGDAAALLRGALAGIELNRGHPAQRDELLSALGVPTVWTVLGPFSPHHLLEQQTPTPPEQQGVIEGSYRGPWGTLTPRTLHFADGRFSLAGEPPQGDVYLLAVDVAVKTPGQYVLRAVTSMDHTATLDGVTLYTRSSWQAPAPTVAAKAVTLDAGAHRLMMRVSRESQQGFLFVSLSRGDGAPAGVSYTAATGPAPAWKREGLDVSQALPEGVYPSAAALEQVLEDEGGSALATFIAVDDGLSRDRDGCKGLLATLPDGFGGALRRALAAELSLYDRTVPPKVARGRATRDLEAALEADPGHVAALLATAQLALDDGRHLDALELINQARAAHSPPSAAAVLLQARVELALGVDASAEATARQAQTLLPGLCDAIGLRADLAARRDAVAETDAAIAEYQGCNNALPRRAEHLKSRGNLPGAIALYEQVLAQDESHLPSITALAGLYVSQRRFDDAVKLLQTSRGSWPRSAQLARELGNVYEHAGKPKEALAAREQALALDGGDLTLRRIVERARTGKELLADLAITSDEALKAYAAAPGDEEAMAAYVLDAAAVRAYPDGSMVDRIHIIQKALDQSGLQDVAEVEVPQGAYVLKMRTLKADGTVLEPESIEGKDSVSLPGVQVGDFIEYEYLMAHPSRGPAQPGFTASSFYFQIARQPNNWSTYKVVAPKGTGLKVDAHNMDAPPPRVVGDDEVFFHEERRVPPSIPEPSGPPSGTEWIPFVSVGAGQTGNEGVVTAYADAYLTLGQVTSEVRRFALGAAGGKTGREAVAALHAAVMHKLSGRDGGLTASAAASVAQDRGSRLMLMYAGLKALGFPTRLAVVHTFNADPAPYLFPNEGQLPYLCLRTTLSDGSFLWLDPIFRFGPFGVLPELASEREALLLPEPGQPLQKVTTPKTTGGTGKQVVLKMSLSEDGVLTGTGSETYLGFSASQLAEALEAIAPDQREQALQSALSRYFGGAELSKLELDVKREVGAPVVVRYAFKAPRFARAEGDGKLVLGALTFPVLLGRRYLTLGARRTPLFLDSVEESFTQASLTLPAGYQLKDALGEVKTACPWGRFVRKETASGSTISVDESYRIEMARVPPAEYERFGTFAGEVDLIQGRDLLAEKTK